MSNYPNQYKSGETQTDEYGNPIRHGSTGTKTTGYQQETAGGYGTGGTEFGTTHNTGGHGTGGIFTGTTAAGHGQTHHRRSGSGSSSSSEDDGQGGRRKKGLKEKIKDKLPGGHKDEHQQGQGQYPSGTTTTTTPGGGYYEQSGQQHHDKKGVMDKVKEKLPGAH